MKARVKATGEIVEFSESSTIYDAGLCHIYDVSELENVPDTNPDYWTRLEHQYAGMAMQGMLAGTEYLNSSLKMIVEDARYIAHAIVEKYKKEERK